MRLPLLVGLSALVLPMAAGAQSVTEQEFLSGFTAESPAVRALTDGLSRAEAARKRAGALANPRADFWREQPDANPRVTNWTLAWTPPLDGRYGLAKKGADAGLAAAREQLAVDKAGLRREVRAAFAAWSLARERRDVLRGQLERVRSLAEAERHRARVGEGSGLSARRFTLAEAEVYAAAAAVDAAFQAADALARAWRPDLAPEAQPAVVTLPEPPEPADATTTPRVQALTFEAEQADLERTRAGRFLGFPTLQFGWQQLSENGVVRSGPIFAAGWSIPVFDRDQGARFEAEGRRQAALARLEVARARVSAEITGGLAAYRTLLTASHEARSTVEESERVTVAATAAFRAGEASLTDLLDSLRAALGARLSEIDLREQATAAHRELESALGRALVGGGF
jgi:outer membrane protein TolC